MWQAIATVIVDRFLKFFFDKIDNWWKLKKKMKKVKKENCQKIKDIKKEECPHTRAKRMKDFLNS